MKLTVTTNVSVDGVMQGLGGPDEDRRGGFDRGGWAPPLVDTETGDHIDQIYGGAAAFLFGRRTYEIFAGSWGAISDMAKRPIGVALNSRVLPVEVSGRVSLDTVAAYAAAGADLISVGSLTHSAPVLDIALDLE